MCHPDAALYGNIMFPSCSFPMTVLSGPLQVQELCEDCFLAYAQHIVLFSNSIASVYILDKILYVQAPHHPLLELAQEARRTNSLAKTDRCAKPSAGKRSAFMVCAKVM